MTRALTRRQMMIGLGAMPLGAALAACSSEQPEIPDLLDLTWQDLIPEEGGISIDRLADGGVVEHGELSTGFEQPAGGAVVEAYDNKEVRLPGFMVPVVNTADGVTAFLLVPYVGACVHVPPPPPNQLVFVTSPQPYALGSLFQPIRVTGIMETMQVNTELASAGYTMEAGHIEEYVEQLS